MSKTSTPEIKMSDVIGISYWYKGATLRDAVVVPDGELSPLTDSADLSEHLNEVTKKFKPASPFTSIRIAFVADETLLCESAQYDAFVNFATSKDWNASGTKAVSGKQQQCYVNPTTNVRSHTVFLSPKRAKIERTKM